jgi:hypothetical protein
MGLSYDKMSGMRYHHWLAMDPARREMTPLHAASGSLSTRLFLLKVGWRVEAAL